MIFLANSLLDGFMTSNMIGRGIVFFQIALSVVAFAVALNKFREMALLDAATRIFMRDVKTFGGVLDYYLKRRPSTTVGVVGIYKETCERLLKQFSPDARLHAAGITPSAGVPAVLSKEEIRLICGECEHKLEAEKMQAARGSGIVATIVALEPMLGLLGTVWGVLDAFAEMGTSGSASLAAIAPSISAALVTTVVGLLIAIPCVIVSNWLNDKINRNINKMENFADELSAQIAFEFQGKDA